MNAFDIITTGFARPIFGNNLVGDPFRDAFRALSSSHKLNNEKGTSGRLSGWAIFRAGGSTVQANLDCRGVQTGDPRTRYEAFADELENFREPVVFIQFSKTTVNMDNVFATYDPRLVKICSPADRPEVFDFNKARMAEHLHGVAERNIIKQWKKRHVE